MAPSRIPLSVVAGCAVACAAVAPAAGAASRQARTRGAVVLRAVPSTRAVRRHAVRRRRAPRIGWPAGEPRRARLAGFSCHRATSPARRSISVQAVMRPVSGTYRLEVRFELLEHVPGAKTVKVQDGDLGTWLRPSDPTLGRHPGDVWRLTKPVSGLDAPARYRFRVEFRWTGVGGHVLARRVRLSRRCEQPQSRPDPVISSITVAPLVAAGTGGDLYTVAIANLGAAGTGPLDLVFDPGGGPASSRTIEQLGPRRSRRLRFAGPACSPANPPSASLYLAPLGRGPASPASTLVASCPAATTATLDSIRR